MPSPSSSPSPFPSPGKPSSLYKSGVSYPPITTDRDRDGDRDRGDNEDIGNDNGHQDDYMGGIGNNSHGGGAGNNYLDMMARQLRQLFHGIGGYVWDKQDKCMSVSC